MNLGTTIIGIICVALCAMPFILTSTNKNKKKKTVLNTLINLANQHNSEISQHEICSYYSIGIDESKKSVSFILDNEETIKKDFINLSSIKTCDVVNLKNTQKDTERLYLKLTHIDKSQPHAILEFYNSEINYQLGSELQSIEKWNTLINSMLHKTNKNLAV